MPVALSTRHADDLSPVPVRLARAAERGIPSELPSAASLGGFLRELHAFSTRQHFARNEVIFHEGNKNDFVYRTISGTVRLCRRTSDGARQIVEFVLEGEMIAIAGNEEYPFSAEAVTPVTLTAYPRGKFERFVESKPAMRAHLLSLLPPDLLATHEPVSSTDCRSTKQRLAAFLVRLAERTDTVVGERLELAMSKLDIADRLGTTVESLCRAFGALRDERSIVVPNTNQLILSNITMLQALAAGA